MKCHRASIRFGCLLNAAICVRSITQFAAISGDAIGDDENYMSMYDMEGHENTIFQMQQFIKRAPEGFATLVLFGDSTMSGLLEKLMNVTREVERSLELVYVSNDRQRKIMEWKENYDGVMNPNHPRDGISPGGDWFDDSKVDDEMINISVMRAHASTNELHSHSCKSGGGIETYVFRKGPYKNLVIHHWGFLPEYSEFCWQPCMAEAFRVLKPTAVVWNIGFHLLNHDFKPSICNRRHNPSKPGCANYKDLVMQGSSQMLDVGVETVIWRHTNWVCEERQMAGFPRTTEALLKWKDVSQRAALEAKCMEDCPQYEGMNCYDWHFNSNTSQNMYVKASNALEELRHKYGNRIGELDTYRATHDCCDRGCVNETDDGEHYAGLDEGFVFQLASMLNAALRPGK